MKDKNSDCQRGPVGEQMRAVIYTRISTAKRATKGEADAYEQDPAVQEVPLKALVAQCGWRLVSCVF